MSLTQALLLGFMCWLTQSNFIGGVAFTQIANKPLTAAFFIGLIMGDMQDAMIVGAALQAIYIGAVAVGGVESMPPINTVMWFAIPAAIVSGGGVDVCVTLALALAAINTPLIQIERNIVMVPLVHLQDRLCQSGNLKVAEWMPMISQIYNFVIDMVVITGLCLVGTDAVVASVAMLPAWITGVLQVFNSLLPLLGFCMLLLSLIKKNYQLVYFVFGFMLFKCAGLSLIAITIFGATIALMQFVATKGNTKEVSENV